MVGYFDTHKDEFGIEPLREELPIATSTYYAAKTAELSARAISNEAALTQIRRVHTENLGVYGARKVHAQLRREGHAFARCTVERLPRRDGLRGVMRHRGPRTSVPAGTAELPLDLVERAFTATAPDQLRVADITYKNVRRMGLERARHRVVVRRVGEDVVGLRPQTGRLTDLRNRSINALEFAVAQYIDWFSHRRRLHSSIGMIPPVEAEQHHYDSHQAPAEHRERVTASLR